MAHQVVAPHAPFGEGGISGCSARGDDNRRDATMEHIESMIEARSQHGRGASGIFRRTKDNNCVSGTDFLEGSGMNDLDGGDRQERNDSHNGQNQ